MGSQDQLWQFLQCGPNGECDIIECPGGITERFYYDGQDCISASLLAPNPPRKYVDMFQIDNSESVCVLFILKKNTVN